MYNVKNLLSAFPRVPRKYLQGAAGKIKLKMCEIFQVCLQYFVAPFFCHEKIALQVEWIKEERYTDIVTFFRLRIVVVLVNSKPRRTA